jgi:RHH-type rel operon transcriptional repressor/antitoxin RelB
LNSETSVLVIRLPLSIEKRLERLARRSKSFYAREAILLHLDDIEDMYLAEHALERIRDGEDDAIPLEEVMKRHSKEGYGLHRVNPQTFIPRKTSATVSRLLEIPVRA